MKDETFTLTADHVKLVRHMQVDWNDEAYDGAPTIDVKRPYGNSDVAGDVHEILTGEFADGDVIVLNHSQNERYLAIHRSTQTALQVILASGSFEPGEYRAPVYTSRWERVA